MPYQPNQNHAVCLPDMTWQRNVHIIGVMKSDLESIYLSYDYVWRDSEAVVDANFDMTENDLNTFAAWKLPEKLQE